MWYWPWTSQNMPVNLSAKGMTRFAARPMISDSSCEPVVPPIEFIALKHRAAECATIARRVIAIPFARSAGDRHLRDGSRFQFLGQVRIVRFEVPAFGRLNGLSGVGIFLDFLYPLDAGRRRGIHRELLVGEI